MKYEKVMEDGLQKQVVEQYVVDALSFAEAEKRITEEMIEKRYLMGAFEKGEYEAVNENPWPSEETMHIIANPYYDMMGPVNPREQKFYGPCCDRCQHRFGTTSNRDWCSDHWKNEKYYRFKLER